MNFTPKNAKIFSCKTCNFECFKQSDFNRHILTAKHKNRTNRTEKTPKNAKANECVCGKKYKSRSSLWYHKKKCDQVNNSIVVSENKVREPTDNSTILELMAQNKELMDMLQEQNKVIQELVPKVGNNNTINNTNNTNNNNFNLQVFLNEDCKDALNFSEFIDKIQVTFDDLENQAQIGYTKGITKLFIENLRDLGTHKRPIHCTDQKRKTIYIKVNDEWDKGGSQESIKKGIQEVTRRTQEILIKKKEENHEEYEDIHSDFSEKCLTIQQNLMPEYPRDTTINKVMENITATSRLDKA